MLYGSMAWLFTERARQKKAGDIKAFLQTSIYINIALVSPSVTLSFRNHT